MSTQTEQLEARSHHPRSPSTLGNREACPCYESRSEAHIRAIAGTLAHAVVETGVDNADLSDQDAIAAAECADFVEGRKKALAELFPDKGIYEFKEKYLPIDKVAFPDTGATTAGFVDEILLVPDEHVAELVDYKFGIWPVEDAETNLQAIAYVLGTFKEWPTVNLVRFFFRQPLVPHNSEWTFHRHEIPELYLRVQVVTARAREASAKLSGMDWSMAKPTVPVCNFCNRIGVCPKVAEISLRVGKKFSSVDVPEYITPTMIHDPAQATLGLRLAQVVSVWASAYKTQVTNRILEGQAGIPDGFGLQSQQRRELISKEKFKEVALRYISEQEYTDSLDVLFGAVEKVINSKAPRGQKEKTLLQFRDALADAGATKQGNPYTFLKAIANKKKESNV